MKSLQQILNILKTEGPQSAKQLAEALDLTTMGVRQHLLSLEGEGKVSYEDHPAVRGRPVRYWTLTEHANEEFENRHEELTLQLIESVQEIFGSAGLEQLINNREQKMRQLYHQALEKQTTLPQKLQVLADIRSREGYMATIQEVDGDWLLLENHCPICAAARQCQNFCRSELSIFQNLLTGLATVAREEHIITGARRCVYRITPI
ncbi:helix-turn-helix transcriptional regulator [Gynuella sunshinyii]|uniref:Putative transcriptional regulator n=1 Tax=Gynuella sunshinyii YC6258 TaxID=1445510 RepID=A0A0C5W289_9GAMM|nr:metalloregulator ArsR/SmtB family transcription factor [Gynuella sunshinyii]AJQ96774.1 putative transcriptional regulator [Gynuella sunshinyii YC6258]